MRVKVYVIDLELPPKVRRLLTYIGLPVATVLASSAVVRADVVSLPNIFASGDVMSAEKLNQNFKALLDEINREDPVCPRGYVKKPDPAASFLPSSIVCAKGPDELVKVGTGGSAFWTDRYEASAWTTPNAQAGTQITDNDEAAYVAAGLPKNGQGTGVFALSVPNAVPSRALTAIQAMEACAASGKRLPDAQEWLRAARGTADPGANDGLFNTKCHSQTAATGPRKTGLGLSTSMAESCVSYWGAQDMIGNLSEFTSEGHSDPNTPSGVGPNNTAVYRGNYWGGSAVGVAAQGWLRSMITGTGQSIGFRCVISGR